jgi:UDP-N-acetylmuramate dehydrogenase
LTTLGVGGPAPWVIEPRGSDELVLAAAALARERVPFRLLGHGSNLLVGDEGIDEVVIHTQRLTGASEALEGCGLRVEAGLPLARLVALALARGLAGAECLIGIPGTVGGAVAGNAGGAHGCIGDLLVSVAVVDADGRVRQVPCERSAFGYRRSPFRGAVIVEAVLALRRESPRTIRDRMRAIHAAKRASQPLTAASAGCMFKNPGGDSSGRLIDQAGCKGLSVGQARVSERHANFFVNEGGAAARDVLALVERVRAQVARTSGHELELEVEVWRGRRAAP